MLKKFWFLWNLRNEVKALTYESIDFDFDPKEGACPSTWMWSTDNFNML